MSDPNEQDTFEVEITDTLDLHSFLPREISAVTCAYLDAAHEKGLRRLVIVHGRGTGTQRAAVHKVLSVDARVASFADAAPEAGGHGATVVLLR